MKCYELFFSSMVNSVANRRSFGVCETTEDSEVGSTIQKALFAFLRKCVCIEKLQYSVIGCIQCKTGEFFDVYLINASRSIHCIVLYGLPLFFNLSMTLSINSLLFELCVMPIDMT